MPGSKRETKRNPIQKLRDKSPTLYKQTPQKILDLVSRVLKQEMTTLDILYKLNFLAKTVLFSIVDFSTQEDYFPVQNGFVYENKLLLESSLKAKKEIVLNCINFGPVPLQGHWPEVLLDVLNWPLSQISYLVI